MKVLEVNSTGYSMASPEFVPGMYRDSRDGEVVLLLQKAGPCLILKEGNRSVYKVVTKAGKVTERYFISGVDVLYDGDFVLSNL